MKFKKNRHYCSPFPWPKFIKGTEINMANKVKFDESIIYELPGEDQHDVNKLFGASSGFHQTNSDRIGFRYNPERNQIEIVLYSYFDKKRVPTMSVCFINIGEEVEIYLNVSLVENARNVSAKVIKNNETIGEVNIQNKKCNWNCFKYSLGGYFGGNRKAPHEINIYCEKI